MRDKHHLPQVREHLERVPRRLPPFMPLKQATIRPKLIDNSSKKTDPLALKLSALETIDAYPKDWIHSYTDGSAFKATINAGYGAVIYFPDGTKEEILYPCGSVCSNYIAEQLAIHSAITYIHNAFDRNPSHIIYYYPLFNAREHIRLQQDLSIYFCLGQLSPKIPRSIPVVSSLSPLFSSKSLLVFLFLSDHLESNGVLLWL